MSVVERVYATRFLGSVLLEPIEGGIALVLLTREGLCIDGPVHVLIELEHFAVLALTALIELQLSVIIEAGTYAVFGEYRLEILQVAALLTCCEHLVSNEGGVVVRVVGEVMSLPLIAVSIRFALIGLLLFDMLMEFHRLYLIRLADALDSEIFTGIFADHIS